MRRTQVVPVENYTTEQDVDESQPKKNLSVVNLFSHSSDWRTTLHAKVANARRKDLAKLRENKKKTFDALTDAFENAEKRLQQCYETLEANALALCSAGNSFNAEMRELNEGNDATLTSSNVSQLGSVPQPGASTSSKLEAPADEGARLAHPIDPSKLIGNRGRLPADMDRILREWMGQPTLISEDLCCSMEKLSMFDNSFTSAASLQPLLFSSVKAHVYLKSGFCDVSLTDDSHLLMAAGSAGLIEYNLSGREERRWRNRPDDLVCTVEALSEGRAAVGVRQQKRLKDANAVSTTGAQEKVISNPQPLVLLLRRTGGESERHMEWTEYFRLNGLRGIPVSISMHAAVLAVTTDNGYLELTTVTTDGGERHGAKHFGYGILSTTVTDQLIVILSRSKVKVKADSRSAHVVDAFRLQDVLTSVDGSDDLHRSLHWRYMLGRSERAMDACPDATCRVLYVAVRGRDWSSSSRVTAISTENGTELWRDVFDCNARLMPYKLSVKECEQRSVMVTLCYDKATKLCGRTGTIHNSVSI